LQKNNTVGQLESDAAIRCHFWVRYCHDDQQNYLIFINPLNILNFFLYCLLLHSRQSNGLRPIVQMRPHMTETMKFKTGGGKMLSKYGVELVLSVFLFSFSQAATLALYYSHNLP